MTQSKQEVITQKNKTHFIKLINKINELENDLSILYIEVDYTIIKRMNKKNKLKNYLSILYIELIELEDNIIKRMNKTNNITFDKENIPIE
tara:strand:- start:411 stop:683 length:273 start_codon:yes stop_codon:yes gene_type:complete